MMKVFPSLDEKSRIINKGKTEEMKRKTRTLNENMLTVAVL